MTGNWRAFEAVECLDQRPIACSEPVVFSEFYSAGFGRIRQLTFMLRIVRLLPACAQLSSLGSIDGQGLDNPRGRKPRDVEVRSVGAQVYGDLNEEVSVIEDCADEVCGPVQAPTGNSGAAMDGSRLPIVANTAR
jgi:hypothetical protein